MAAEARKDAPHSRYFNVGANAAMEGEKASLDAGKRCQCWIKG